MLYQVTHETTYHYSDPVSLCHNLAHLTPRCVARQNCLDSNLVIEPQPSAAATYDDYFGNPTTFVTLQEPHRRLRVTATHTVAVTPPDFLDPSQTMPWEAVQQLLAGDRSPDLVEAYQFTLDSAHVFVSLELADYAAPSFPTGQPILAALLDLTRRIHEDFRYDPRATTISTPLREVFANRLGVCQDFAHLEIACLRALGLAARYVSGYLCTEPPPGQVRLRGADASHAWLAVYCPPFGWVDVDPTNNVIPSDKHILLAWGRDFADVTPMKGVILGGGSHTVQVAVDVVPMAEE